MIKEKIGLIAGSRKFPILFSVAAKKKDYQVVALAVKGDTSRQLSKYVDKIYWLGLNEFGKVFEILRQEGIKSVVMAGQINPRRLFSPQLNASQELKELLAGIKDSKAESIFGAICDRFEKNGFRVLDSTLFLEDLLPARGCLSGDNPSFNEWEDIYFGFDLAKKVAFLDIGQTVAVKNKAVVAVEALEGTDALIRRAARIAKNGFVVVKVSRPNQDMRYDIPVVGLKTILTLIKSKASCLAIEAKKTLFIDKEEALKIARNNSFKIVAV